MFEKVKRKWKVKNLRLFAGIIIAAFITGAAAAVIYVKPWEIKGPKTADGQKSIAAVQEAFGNSSIESLAPLKGLNSMEHPVEYLVKNSIFIIDQAYVKEMANKECLAMESTAMANNISYANYVADKYNGMTLDEYEKEVYDKYEQFVKERLVVYEVAKRKKIIISESEYNDLLFGYAEKFGYEDTASFEFECDTGSIAVEMLYDKTVAWLISRAGYTFEG